MDGRCVKAAADGQHHLLSMQAVSAEPYAAVLMASYRRRYHGPFGKLNFVVPDRSGLHGEEFGGGGVGDGDLDGGAAVGGDQVVGDVGAVEGDGVDGGAGGQDGADGEGQALGAGDLGAVGGTVAGGGLGQSAGADVQVADRHGGPGGRDLGDDGDRVGRGVGGDAEEVGDHGPQEAVTGPGLHHGGAAGDGLEGVVLGAGGQFGQGAGHFRGELAGDLVHVGDGLGQAAVVGLADGQGAGVDQVAALAAGAGRAAYAVNVQAAGAGEGGGFQLGQGGGGVGDRGDVLLHGGDAGPPALLELLAGRGAAGAGGG